MFCLGLGVYSGLQRHVFAQGAVGCAMAALA